MSIAMPVDVIQKVLKKFDKGSDVKINKYVLRYNKGPGYKWSFYGTINGEEARLSLTKNRDGSYSLKKTETKVVEEFMHRNIKTVTEEKL